MVEGASVALRRGTAGAGTLAISEPKDSRQAADHPPFRPSIPRGGRCRRDQEERDAACAAPQLRDPSPRARNRYQVHPGALRAQQTGYDGSLHARRHRPDRQYREPCLYRKSDSAIMVMKAAENGRRYDAAHVLDRAIDRSVLVERPMSPQLIIISGILRQYPAQVRFAQNNHMVDALAPDRTDQPFGEAVLPRRARGDRLVTDAHGP